MNSEFDDFQNAIDNIEIKTKRDAFKINQLKLEHFHWFSGEIYPGKPVSTSIELTSAYDHIQNICHWQKTISRTYISLEDGKTYLTNKHSETLDNADDLIKKIEEYDLRDLKNNYFNEAEPECYTYWELTYNNHFKIVGTYDECIKEFDIISELLDFKNIIDEESKKVTNHE